MAKFDEVLAEFKASSEAGSVLPICEDVNLRNGVIAWKSIRIERVENGECPESDAGSKWDWLWKQVKFDLVLFGRIAGIPYQDTGNVFERLKWLRFIYPDGTVNTFAQQLLNSMLAAMLSKGKKAMQKSVKK